MIIGLGHQRRQGKDAVADILVKNHGFTKMSFTLDGGLQDACMALNPIVDMEVAYNDQTLLGTPYWEKKPVRYADACNELGYEGAKDKYPEVVRTLQRMGTEVGRHHLGKFLGTPDVWVDIAMAKALNYGNVVFTNVRFENELTKIKDSGGCVVRVVRPGYELSDSSEIAQHVSESSVPENLWDYTIFNNGTLEHLEQLVDTFMMVGRK